jgi:hypothetical protein
MRESESHCNPLQWWWTQQCDSNRCWWYPTTSLLQSSLPNLPHHPVGHQWWSCYSLQPHCLRRHQ